MLIITVLVAQLEYLHGSMTERRFEVTAVTAKVEDDSTNLEVITWGDEDVIYLQKENYPFT